MRVKTYIKEIEKKKEGEVRSEDKGGMEGSSTLLT